MRALFGSVLKVRFLLEAGCIGLFLIQALRYLVGALYGRIGSASVFPAIDPALINPDIPGLLNPSVVQTEITLLVVMAALPILAVLIGRVRPLLMVVTVGVAAGRALMLQPTLITSASAAAITVGFGLLYIAFIVRQRAYTLPYLFVLGFGADQLFRAVGNTLDPSWSPAYANIQLGVSAALVLLSLINF
ncbi:MAG: hypothetical protein H7Y11_02915, partial [Armatimonadetes bacterium]|nr:hypothetical protein [Anaerolineae bacterium]